MYIRFVKFDLLPLIPDVGSGGRDATEESDQKYGDGIQHIFTRLSRSIPNRAPPVGMG
jgi:hypothetical protein